jgi:hypothetical protein
MSWILVQWDRAGAWLAIAAGLGALIAGWIGTSGTGYAAEQIPYVISGGLIGLFLLGIGAMLWLSADLRDEWRKLDDLEQAVRAHTETLDATRELESSPSKRTTGTASR